MFSFLISKNMACEIGFNEMITCTQFGIHFELSFRYDCDHRGFFFNIYTWKYGFEFNIYSTLHKTYGGEYYYR